MADPTLNPDAASHASIAGRPPSHFKYATYIKNINGCPFAAHADFGEFSYHIVHSKKDHPDNFRPAALKYPDRFVDEGDETRCKSWALSMFESLEQLKAHFEKMTDRMPNWGKLQGNHYVRLKIGSTHGRRTNSGKNGHFSFHEYADCDLAAAADSHGPLVA